MTKIKTVDQIIAHSSRFHSYSIGDVSKPNPRVQTRPCAGCPNKIYPGEETRETEAGTMHWLCAKKYVFAQLTSCGLPQPTSSDPFRIKQYLEKQFSENIKEKNNEKSEPKLTVINEVARFLLNPIHFAPFATNDML